MALYATRQFRPNPPQLHVAGEEAAQPAVNFIRRDACGKMVAPYFRWRVDSRKIRKANHRAGTVRRGKVQNRREAGRGKANHLRELACGDKRTVRLGDHKIRSKANPLMSASA